MSSEEWTDRGAASDGAELLRGLMDPVDGTEVRIARHTASGRDYVVYVAPNQTLNEAIAGRQLRELDAQVQAVGPSATARGIPTSPASPSPVPSMSFGDWEDRGTAAQGAELLRWLMDPVEGTEVRQIRNTKTGQDLVVYVEPNQTLADAVANGQCREIGQGPTGPPVDAH